jgi:thioredoxin 1
MSVPGELEQPPPESPRVVAADAAELDALLASERGLLVLYMWGPDCPNCVVFARRLPVLLERLGHVPLLLVKVDVYAHPEVSRRYGVMGIPHFLLFRDGKRIGKMSEFHGDAFWLQVIRDHLPGGAEAPPA